MDCVLALNNSNPLTRVRMPHSMKLQSNGRTMLNVVTMRKLSAVAQGVTKFTSNLLMLRLPVGRF